MPDARTKDEKLEEVERLELLDDVDKTLNRLSRLSERAKSLGLPELHYAINRAWREIFDDRLKR